MSDVTYTPPTYTPQSVPEDQEMSRVRDIFDRALNALVDASSLAKTVEGLKADLEGLKAQVAHYRNTIANQDDQITRIRQDRDAARTAQYQAEDNLRHQGNELENIRRDHDSALSSNSRLNDRIQELTKERDDAQYKLLELEESNKSLSAKLESIKSALGMFAVEPPKPEVSPTPVEPSATVTEFPATHHDYDLAEPEVQPEPEQQQVKSW